MGEIDHRRLEAGKAHVERVPLDARARQVVHAARALLRQLVHRLAAGIGHPEHTRGLVEAFARRVVARRADENKVGIIPHVHEQRVAAGHAQRQERRLQLRERQIIRGDVAADMMHRNERHAQRVGDGLGEAQPHQNRADQARRVGDRHRVDVPLRHARVRERLVRQRGNGLDVLARGDLRHHAAVERVHIRLRRDGVREHAPPVLDDRHRGLVAGGFKSQYFHLICFFLSFFAASLTRPPGACARPRRRGGSSKAAAKTCYHS